jgi:hypothetical protein
VGRKAAEMLSMKFEEVRGLAGGVCHGALLDAMKPGSAQPNTVGVVLPAVSRQ